jgi:hypothetical protein
MAQIGTITPACWLDHLPEFPEDAFALLTDKGWADQSALFFPERYAPVPQRLIITAPNLTALANTVTQLRALRRTKVRVDDGLHPQNNCLVLGVQVGKAERCVMIIGGSSSGDTWEQAIVVTVLPPSPAVA